MLIKSRDGQIYDNGLELNNINALIGEKTLENEKLSN
jgi:hypothetical protein